MKKTVMSLAVATALWLPMIAQAAQPVAVVAKIDGNAVATQGERYLTVHDGMKLSEGDRIMVLEGSQAVLTYRDGCRLDLPEMAILSVQASSTCALNGVGVYQPDPQSGIAPGTPPKPQLAAMGTKKARSKAECDLAAKNNDPKDDCSCDERRKNNDKDDDTCLAGGVAAGTGTGVGVATSDKASAAAPTTADGGTTMVSTTAVPTIALVGGLFAVTGGVTAAVANSNKSNNDDPKPVSP